MPFRGDGAFGQYMIVMPDKDAVMAITRETADMQNEKINLHPSGIKRQQGSQRQSE